MKISRDHVGKFLSGGSAGFGSLAILCLFVFMLSPKNGIAVVMAFSLFGCIGSAAIGLLLGTLGLIISRENYQLALTGLFTSIIALCGLLIYY